MTAWAGGISLSKDSPDVVADLPQVLRLAELAWQAEPDYDQGSLASMMGTLELAKPGGKTSMLKSILTSPLNGVAVKFRPLFQRRKIGLSQPKTVLHLNDC